MRTLRVFIIATILALMARFVALWIFGGPQWLIIGCTVAAAAVAFVLDEVMTRRERGTKRGSGSSNT